MFEEEEVEGGEDESFESGGWREGVIRRGLEQRGLQARTSETLSRRRVLRSPVGDLAILLPASAGLTTRNRPQFFGLLHRFRENLLCLFESSGVSL